MGETTDEPHGPGAQPAPSSPRERAFEEPTEATSHLRADAARNLERVVAAATEAFAEDGIAVPMEVIAKRAGVGVATIYRQFPTKESLFLAVVQREMKKIFGLARELERSDDPAAALAEFVSVLLDTVASKRDLAQALERSGLHTKESPEVEQLWRASLQGLVERAKRAGAVCEDLSVDDVLFLVSGACSAVINHAPDREARQRMGRVLCDGFRPSPVKAAKHTE